MTSKELNKMLIEAFPTLAESYAEEVSWQEGDDTGSHVVYGDVLRPHIIECMEQERDTDLAKAFEYLEQLLEKEDAYADEVVGFSVLEGIESSIAERPKVLSVMGKRTRALLAELQLGYRAQGETDEAAIRERGSRRSEE